MNQRYLILIFDFSNRLHDFRKRTLFFSRVSFRVIIFAQNILQYLPCNIDVCVNKVSTTCYVALLMNAAHKSKPSSTLSLMK